MNSELEFKLHFFFQTNTQNWWCNHQNHQIYLIWLLLWRETSHENVLTRNSCRRLLKACSTQEVGVPSTCRGRQQWQDCSEVLICNKSGFAIHNQGNLQNGTCGILRTWCHCIIYLHILISSGFVAPDPKNHSRCDLALKNPTQWSIHSPPSLLVLAIYCITPPKKG